MLRIGFARREIPARNGTPLIGYENCPGRRAEGTHDPLYAKALALEAGGRRYGVVCCDLLAVDASMRARLAARAKELGFADGDVFLCAIHTHSAPGGCFTPDPRFGGLLELVFGAPDGEFTETVDDAAFGALRAAADALREGDVSAACVRAPGIGTDRNDPAKPGDPTLTVFRFRQKQGKTLLLYNTACHPTVLREDNRLVSADWPGETARRLERDGYADMAMFLNGSAGDVSTRFTRAGEGFAETQRLGGLLAEQIAGALPQLAPCGQTLESFAFSEDLAVRRADPAAAQRELAAAQAEFARAKADGRTGTALRRVQASLEGASLGALYARFQPAEETLPLEVRGLRIGEFALCFFPVELFSALSNPLRASFGQRAVPVSYADGYMGYLPDAAIAASDHYEKYTTVFGYGEGEKLLRRAHAALRDTLGGGAGQTAHR
ncbi:MAG: neutral/alkaline non-lysosomal ceramidase N-terminal domain-containing protein [Oscillospiraceae bacterium]|nr:neutral/alkaline non-lysosomal ceramidase N-terminal domain-containing protein [Oscillospiraceae bacterium]